MKKIVSIILMIIVISSCVGCQRIMRDEAEYIEKAREEFSISDVETIEIRFIGEVIRGDNALLWFVSGNEQQTQNYLPMSCSIIKDGGRVFEHTYNIVERGTDIVAVMDWCNGYAFCINNSKCKTIKIDDCMGEKKIEITEIPFIYFIDQLPCEYTFLDENGKKIN